MAVGDENDFTEMLSTYPDGELLTMVYQFDRDPALLRGVEKELTLRNILPPDVTIRKQSIFDRDHAILSHGKAATFSQNFFGWLGIFGLLGLIIGHHLYTGKIISAYTGKEYFRYNEESRENGRYMFYVSIITHTLFILLKGLPWINNKFF